MRFCKDCKYHFNGECQAPDAEERRNPVSGMWPLARDMRSTPLHCGHFAYWYDPTYPDKA